MRAGVLNPLLLWRRPGAARKAGNGLGLAFWLALAWIVGLSLAAVLLDVLPLHDPLKQNYDALNADPSWRFWLGTDTFGRDLVSRALYGARVSLIVAIAAPSIGLVIGLVVGMSGGYFGGWVDFAVGIVTDTILAFPNIVLAIAVLFYAGASLPVLILVIAFYTIPRFVRVARGNTILFAKREFVLAAHAQGASHARILLRELLPNVLIPVLTYTLTVMSFAVILEGSLSFLGLGIPPPTPTWGRMVAEGIQDLSVDPKCSLVPSAFIFLTIFSLNLMADRLRARTEVKASNL